MQAGVQQSEIGDDVDEARAHLDVGARGLGTAHVVPQKMPWRSAAAAIFWRPRG